MNVVELDYSHVEECRHIYRSAVLAVDEGLYSFAQKREWASYAGEAGFPPFVLCGFAYGMVGAAYGRPGADCIAAFCSATKTGHINSLYVHPDRQRKGCAGKLLDILLANFAPRQKLTVDASKLSLPLFLSRGFSVVAQESVSRNGVLIPRFKIKR